MKKFRYLITDFDNGQVSLMTLVLFNSIHVSFLFRMSSSIKSKNANFLTIHMLLMREQEDLVSYLYILLSFVTFLLCYLVIY